MEPVVRGAFTKEQENRHFDFLPFKGRRKESWPPETSPTSLILASQTLFVIVAKLPLWRTSKRFEVDLILGNEIAVEFKLSHEVSDKHLKGLRGEANLHCNREDFLLSKNLFSTIK